MMLDVFTPELPGEMFVDVPGSESRGSVRVDATGTTGGRYAAESATGASTPCPGITGRYLPGTDS